MTSPLDSVLTTADAADILGVSQAYVNVLIASGALRARKVSALWLLTRDDLDEYLRTRQRQRVRPIDRAEDFDHTRDDHKGSIRLGAARLNVSPRTLARSLHRARQAGWQGTFTDDRPRRTA